MNHKAQSDPVQVVWFKRDLRVADHAALAGAAAAREDGPVLPLYIVEPELWRQPDMAGRHWAFIADCLSEVQTDLADLGQPLLIRTGEAVNVLEAIRADRGIAALWSHQETGQAWTFERDKRVLAWARAHGIAWHEPRQNGVIRRLKSRDGWAKRWDRFMGEQVHSAPRLDPVAMIDPGSIPSARDLGLADDPVPGRQQGGRAVGLGLLKTFLETRGETYRWAMSSPVTAAEACSRLSPHLAWGSLSIREVTQATWARQRDLKDLARKEDGAFRASLSSFNGRLHWHCHFMQKLEDEPRTEFENFHRGYDGMREEDFREDYFTAWAEGRTGYPFVDACMRSLHHTGWINFRMRAMLMSMASYHLWLHWRPTSLHLARLFTDYEPGIHYSQAQMQSGTTGINTVRIYSPIKQSTDQDPDGAFIRRYVPELAALPDKHIHTPWTLSPLELSDAGLELGTDYPLPIVDHATASKAAK
ncbi:MAG: FAD-binding domain-containing protein, partial [Pseudomonadota bacterium]